ncbi:ribonuclease III [Limibacillus sp. MBR-115]|jgi:ribonuclease-3|uniref:ribonuclease III n=1 Tax=Limibacillus sp. MBR-115 TaxID=3156465 RepID=UPI003395E8FE
MVSSKKNAPLSQPGRLADRLGYSFTKPERLLTALTHSSTLGQDRGGSDSYERLEFLGDRVLGLVVADLLLARFAQESEGAIAKRFALLVSQQVLAEVARDIGLGEFIRLSPGEDDSGGRDNPAILSDVMEAVIAALYRDGGLEVARAFIEPRWISLIEADLSPPREPKTALQEWAQGRGLPLPSYRLVSRKGPDHEPAFTVEVTVSGEGSGEGTGRSKRLAEQAAAERLLARLDRQQTNMDQSQRKGRT